MSHCFKLLQQLVRAIGFYRIDFPLGTPQTLDSRWQRARAKQTFYGATIIDFRCYKTFDHIHGRSTKRMHGVVEIKTIKAH